MRSQPLADETGPAPARQWAADWFGPYPESAPTDPKGPDKATERVAQGGDFLGTNVAWANPAWRFSTDPGTYNHAIGFRRARAGLRGRTPRAPDGRRLV